MSLNHWALQLVVSGSEAAKEPTEMVDQPKPSDTTPRKVSPHPENQHLLKETLIHIVGDTTNTEYVIIGRVGHKETIEYIVRKMRPKVWERIQTLLDLSSHRHMVSWRDVKVVIRSPYKDTREYKVTAAEWWHTLTSEEPNE
jgi:hypothetical protein